MVKFIKRPVGRQIFSCLLWFVNVAWDLDWHAKIGVGMKCKSSFTRIFYAWWCSWHDGVFFLVVINCAQISASRCLSTTTYYSSLTAFQKRTFRSSEGTSKAQTEGKKLQSWNSENLALEVVRLLLKKAKIDFRLNFSFRHFSFLLLPLGKRT